jgi:hypothetical protein
MNLQAKLMMTALSLGALRPGRWPRPPNSKTMAASPGQPRVEQIRQPREECRTEYVQVPVQQQQQRSAGGSIVGAIAGGILGNQVGGGSGRAAATAAGAIAGAVVGDRVDNNGRRPVQPAMTAGTGRAPVPHRRFLGIAHGRLRRHLRLSRPQLHQVMPRDPGQRVRLRVSVEPDQQ